ncbi:hypothetical protein Scel_50430 [Streptomyces cellostaticus]|uniref:hypothetical protein n=1 Tax=Streptomyces cellostaticus TaxID=67285 RepID=UPI0025CA6C68|nr:hypothetical protein [Streptomyces cellostaticus]GHI06722.1 hypothetical protein Scel_50430 [Streptomyces cellostaticus]
MLLFLDVGGPLIPFGAADRAYPVYDSGRALPPEAAESLDDWEMAHRARIDALLAERGFEG